MAPQVMRVETMRGEATLILDHGVVEHASPAIIWALGLPFPVLMRRLNALEWVAVMVEGKNIRYVNGGAT